MQTSRDSEGWNGRSVLVAAATAFVSLTGFAQLARLGGWPEGEEWALIVLPAVIGSAVLAWRHPNTKVLSAAVAFPLLWALMFYAAACLPLS